MLIEFYAGLWLLSLVFGGLGIFLKKKVFGVLSIALLSSVGIASFGIQKTFCELGEGATQTLVNSTYATQTFVWTCTSQTYVDNSLAAVAFALGALMLYLTFMGYMEDAMKPKNAMDYKARY